MEQYNDTPHPQSVKYKDLDDKAIKAIRDGFSRDTHRWGRV